MKLIIFTLSFILNLTAFAHIEKGTWKGIISETANCFMEVEETSFNNGIKNPLNERISIKIGNTHYSVKHPYIIDTNSGHVSFNHDLFEDVVPTEFGAFALQIEMIHASSFEGPKSYYVMEHNWQTGDKEVIHCKDLKLVFSK